MNIESVKQTDKDIYYRLVSLWVICEAFAGGIVHGIKLPFSGLIISSMAVCCIILIAWHVPSKTAIIKATMIVAIFKLMLSPHSPPTAYLAVFFQGLIGQLLFLSKRSFNISAILLAVLSLVESAIQRILVLVIIYGNAFWKAVDQYIQKLTGERTMTNYSLRIAIGYIIIHAIVGIFVGMYAARLAKRSMHWRSKYPELIIPYTGETTLLEQQRPKKRNKIKLIFIVLWAMLLLLFFQTIFYPTRSVVSMNEITGIFFRSMLIILSWYLFIAPLIMKFLKKILVAQQSKRKLEMNKVLELLPQTKYIFMEGWRRSAEKKGYQRLGYFFKILLINILSAEAIK